MAECVGVVVNGSWIDCSKNGGRCRYVRAAESRDRILSKFSSIPQALTSPSRSKNTHKHTQSITFNEVGLNEGKLTGQAL